MRRAFFLVLFCGLLATPFEADAQKPFAVESFGARPFRGARENYFSLLRQIAGDSVGDDEEDKLPTIDRSFDLRKLFAGEGDEENTLYEAPLVVQNAEAWKFEAQGENHLALLLEVSNLQAADSDPLFTQYILAVFRVRLSAIRGGGKLERLELVEAVDPQTDRFTEFSGELPLIQTSRGNQAFWIKNHHWNAGENFRDYASVGVAADNRVNPAIENLPGAYTNAHCADGTEEFFSVERLKRKPKNYLPYNFVLKTFSWTENACEKAGEIVYTREEKRVYRASWTRTAKNKRRVLRARLIKTLKRRVRIVPQD